MIYLERETEITKMDKQKKLIVCLNGDNFKILEKRQKQTKSLTTKEQLTQYEEIRKKDMKLLMNGTN